MSRMKWIFSGISLLLLSAGLGGISWCGDWKLLLAFPVAFGIGCGRGAMSASIRDMGPDDGILSQFPWQRIAFAIRVFIPFALVFFTGTAVLHFTRTPNDLVWTKACWFAGLVLLPWVWRWTNARTKAESIAAFALTLPTAVLISAFPKLTDVWVMAESFAIAAVLVAVHKVLNRKGVPA